MIHDQFHAMAALRGWPVEKQVTVLLDYIAGQDSSPAFLDVLARQESSPAMDRADRFLWTVADRLQHRGLVLDAAFQLFCLDTFDLFSPDEAAAEWRRRRER